MIIRNIHEAMRRTRVIDDETAEMLRKKTPTERIAMCFELTRLFRLRLYKHYQGLHPDWDEKQVLRAVAQKWLSLSKT